MRFKCALVDGLIDGAGAAVDLSKDDRDRLALGMAWDEVTTVPYRLQVPLHFCRHATRPGPKWFGQKCNIEGGMMCVFIDEPPFDDMFGFENFATAALTVLILCFWLALVAFICEVVILVSGQLFFSPCLSKPQGCSYSMRHRRCCSSFCNKNLIRWC